MTRHGTLVSCSCLSAVGSERVSVSHRAEVIQVRSGPVGDVRVFGDITWESVVSDRKFGNQVERDEFLEH